MNPSPLEYIESLHIGTVEFVSPDEIKVSLDIEAPDSVALNTGTPRPFPRVNGYVLIPSDEGYLVGQVEWLTIERSASYAFASPSGFSTLARLPVTAHSTASHIDVLPVPLMPNSTVISLPKGKTIFLPIPRKLVNETFSSDTLY